MQTEEPPDTRQCVPQSSAEPGGTPAQQGLAHGSAASRWACCGVWMLPSAPLCLPHILRDLGSPLHTCCCRGEDLQERRFSSAMSRQHHCWDDRTWQPKSCQQLGQALAAQPKSEQGLKSALDRKLLKCPRAAGHSSWPHPVEREIGRALWLPLQASLQQAQPPALLRKPQTCVWPWEVPSRGNTTALGNSWEAALPGRPPTSAP